MCMNSLCSHGTDLAPSVSRLQFVALPLLLPRAKTLGQTHRAWSRGWLAFATAPGTAICAHRAIAIASPGTSNAYAGPLVILNARIYPLAIWTDLSYFPRHHRASCGSLPPTSVLQAGLSSTERRATCSQAVLTVPRRVLSSTGRSRQARWGGRLRTITMCP